jgi:opacity protein-like surface antigen
MKAKFIASVILLLATLAPSSQAGLQIGVGPSLYSGTQFDTDSGYGVNAELGYLWSGLPVHFFLGAKGTYVDGLGSGALNLDLFEGALAGRALVPIGANWLKAYAEASIGTANLSISGETNVKTKINGRTVSFNSKFDEKDWVLAYGFGVGVQFDFTSWIGLRIGYEFHSLGEVEAFGMKEDPGKLNGVVTSIVLKF